MGVVTQNQPLSVGNLEAVLEALNLYKPVNLSGDVSYYDSMIGGSETYDERLNFHPAIVIPEDGKYQVYAEGKLSYESGGMRSHSLGVYAGSKYMDVENKSAQVTLDLSAGDKVQARLAYYSESGGYWWLSASASCQVTRVG